MEEVKVLPKKDQSAQRHRILLIEDNPDDVAAIREFLRDRPGSSFEIDFCERLSDALDRLGRKEAEVDVVLLDLSLPDSFGMETLTRFRSSIPDLPVVILTGLDDEAAALEAIKCGAQDYLLKLHMSAESLSRSIRHAIVRNQLLQANRKLEQTREDFISILSHELRSPITVIQGAAEQLFEGFHGILPGKQREYAEMIFRNSDHMNRLILNILTLSRLESGRVTIQRRHFPVAGLAEEIVRDFQMDTEKNGCRIVNETAAGLPDLYADRDMVTEVLTNLVGNALRFSTETVRIRASVEGRTIRISVVDDGPGIPPEKMDRLFGRFVQIDRGRRDPHGYKGTGLGLVICKRIIEALNGKICAENLSPGAAFHVLLPAFDESLAFDMALEEEIRQRRADEPLSMIVVNVPEPAWMPVVERKIESTLRDEDRMLRKGCLLVILARADRDGALQILRRIKLEARSPYPREGTAIPKGSLTLGMASIPGDTTDPRALLEAAVRDLTGDTAR